MLSVYDSDPSEVYPRLLLQGSAYVCVLALLARCTQEQLHKLKLQDVRDTQLAHTRKRLVAVAPVNVPPPADAPKPIPWTAALEAEARLQGANYVMDGLLFPEDDRDEESLELITPNTGGQP